MTSDVPVVSAKGLSSQRQLEALNSAPKYFAKHQLRSARVATGIDIEYVLHTVHSERDQCACKEGGNKTLETCVVLVMGILQPMEWWTGIIDMLLEKYAAQHGDVAILAFNNRGTGGSSAPWPGYSTSQMAKDTLALMDHVGWDAANIVGISMGGMITLELASLAPQRVQSLSLMVTTRGRHASDSRSFRPLRKAALSRNPSKAVTNLLELLYPLDVIRTSHMDSGESVHDALFAFHLAKHPQQVVPPIFGILGQTRALHTHFVSDERLTDIKKAGFPILLIGSMRDILIPPIESIKLKERLDADHVHTLFFESAGHGVNIQCVEEVADALLATFKRVRPH